MCPNGSLFVVIAQEHELQNGKEPCVFPNDTIKMRWWPGIGDHYTPFVPPRGAGAVPCILLSPYFIPPIHSSSLLTFFSFYGWLRAQFQNCTWYRTNNKTVSWSLVSWSFFTLASWLFTFPSCYFRNVSKIEKNLIYLYFNLKVSN